MCVSVYICVQHMSEDVPHLTSNGCVPVPMSQHCLLLFDKRLHSYRKSPCFVGKSSILGHGFHSELWVYGRVASHIGHFQQVNQPIAFHAPSPGNRITTHFSSSRHLLLGSNLPAGKHDVSCIRIFLWWSQTRIRDNAMVASGRWCFSIQKATA